MRNEIKQLKAEIARLSARLDQRPAKITLGRPAAYMFIYVDGGNTLETGQDGVNYEASVTSVPSAYDPNVTSSFIDGIGRGTLYRNGVAQTGYVLLVNSDASTFGNALLEGDLIWASGPISMPVDGGGSVLVYLVG